MVKLRLQRHGRKKLPYYHIVAADVRAKRDGRIIEDLGRFSPTHEPALKSLATDRVIHWLKTGAQPSDTVRSILKKEGIYYRLHLERWGKSQDEIEQTISKWKIERDNKAVQPNTRAAQMKAQLKAEEDAYVKEQEARAKAQAEAAEKAAAEKAAAEKAAEEKAAEERAAAEKAAAEKAAESGETTDKDTSTESPEDPALDTSEAPEEKAKPAAAEDVPGEKAVTDEAAATDKPTSDKK